MAYFMFVDESGQDQHESPYEVLAGIVIEDRKLWPLVRALHTAELNHFGCRYGSVERELKAKRLLKKKVFRHAESHPPFDADTRKELASACLLDGGRATPEHHAALGQAKLAYVLDALRIAARFDCRAFASIAPKDAPRPPAGEHLRKDYAFLFERFYFYLTKRRGNPLGIVVFDELDRSQSHLLIDQMERYFMDTYTGQTRSSRIIPEPFFVHSHLTTGVHLADLIAYVISWGVREPGMTEDPRPELEKFAEAACALRQNLTVRTTRKRRKGGQLVEVTTTRAVWAFNVLPDLRARSQRENS